uniref:Uncharacterized protein n=1 Tax=Arundo donax TaxID=35708 RepID=A0A0A9CI31_ARUDO
MNPAIAYRMKP